MGLNTEARTDRQTAEAFYFGSFSFGVAWKEVYIEKVF